MKLGFPGGSVGKESASNAGDLGLIPELGKFPEEGKGYLLQNSGLENSMDCIGSVYGVFSSSMGHKELDTTEQLALSRIIVQWSEVIGYRSQVRCLTEQEQMKWVKCQRSGVTC